MEGVAAVLARFFTLAAVLLFPTVVLLAVLIFYLRRRRARMRPEYLCDSCKYNTPVYCNRPMRPHATVCDAYREEVDPDEVGL